MASQDHSSLPPLGIIVIDVQIPRPPGDPFNKRTWPFPLIQERVEGYGEAQVVTNGKYDAKFIDAFVQAGERLAEQDCVGIITSCGFLAMAQTELAARLPIPIATSALIQIPSIFSWLPPNTEVGIITYDDRRLGPTHLEQLGVSALNIAKICIRGAKPDGPLHRMIKDSGPYATADMEAELIDVAREMITSFPQVKAIVLECTQMPPFAEAIQSAVGVPVYDIYSLGLWFYGGLVKRTPAQWK